MNRKHILENKDVSHLFNDLNDLHNLFFDEFKNQFDRSLPFNDEIFDRWERAQKLGFGEGSSIYDSSYVFGNVKVGKNCWVGQFTIIDGSGGLQIGDHCTVSAGTHIYTHSNVKQTLTGGKCPIERQPVSIGNNCYIGPQSVVTMGTSIGNNCLIGSNTFVNKSVPDNCIVVGNPGKVIGRVVIKDDNVEFIYEKE